MLLGIDNVTREARDVIRALLASAPHLKVLAVSRTPLHLSDELEYMVLPLGLPQSENPTQGTAASLLQHDALRLFVERAQRWNPLFSLDDVTAGHVAEACRHLRGLPLALELVAARLDASSLTDVLGGLKQRLPPTTIGVSKSPSDSLTQTLIWSYESLASSEQLVLRSVSVFAAGFTEAAAESICSCPPDRMIRESLEILQDAQLLRLHLDGNEQRYFLPKSVREFASEQLESSGEVEEVRRRFALYWLQIAHESDKQPHHVEGNLAQLRLAIEWALTNDVEMAQEIAATLSPFWLHSNRVAEGRLWLKRALDAHTEPATLAYARALREAGQLGLVAGSYSTATTYLDMALATSRTLGDLEGVAKSLFYQGMLARMEGQLEGATAAFTGALTICEELRAGRSVATILLNLGEIASNRDDRVSASAYFSRVLEQARAIGDELHMAHALHALGLLAVQNGAPKTAVPYFAQALLMARRLSDARLIASALEGITNAARSIGSTADVGRLMDLSRNLSAGNPSGLAATTQTDGTEMSQDEAPATTLLSDSVGPTRQSIMDETAIDALGIAVELLDTSSESTII
jgi:non-specific serine/threonine protein kinase